MEGKCPLFDSLKSKNVTLTITKKCNLSCVYCYEHSKTAENMTLQTAIDIIEKELQADDGTQAITFDFFGGEPFLNFELMKECLDYYKHIKKTKPVRFFLSTNGTLVHGQIQDWLRENKQLITCGLSLDGNKKVHDLNRSDSYDDIDLDFFVKEYPWQPIKMTLYPATIDCFAESVIDCHKKGFKVSCNLAYGVDWSGDVLRNTFENELKKLVDFYVENPDIAPCSMLDRMILVLGQESKDKETIHKWCGVKTHMHTYDVDGTLYPCQHFMPISCGDQNAVKFEDLDVEEECSICNLNEECRECLFLRLCPNCYGANYVNTGNIYLRDMKMCELLKLQFKACAYLQATKYFRGELKMSSDEEILFARAILKIQELD